MRRRIPLHIFQLRHRRCAGVLFALIETMTAVATVWSAFVLDTILTESFEKTPSERIVYEILEGVYRSVLCVGSASTDSVGLSEFAVLPRSILGPVLSRGICVLPRSVRCRSVLSPTVLLRLCVRSIFDVRRKPDD